MTVRAILNGVVLAESDQTIVVEGNHYFPPDSLKKEYFTPTDTHTSCPWKGEASYYTVTVDGEVGEDAAWTYPDPLPEAQEIKDYVAFWGAVAVTE